MQPPKRMKCAHCDYEWYTKSEKKLVTCPNCMLKTPNTTEETEETEAARA